MKHKYFDGHPSTRLQSMSEDMNTFSDMLSAMDSRYFQDNPDKVIVFISNQQKLWSMVSEDISDSDRSDITTMEGDDEEKE